MTSISSLALFFRKLEAMVGAGIPVHAALDILEGEQDRLLREALDEVRDRIHTGSMLSVAMDQTGVFPSLCVQTIRNGESSGHLLQALGCLADYLERTSDLRRKLQAAFTYPALILVLTFLIVAVLGAYVFPRQAALAQSLGAEVPWITSALTAGLGVLFNPYTLALALAAVALGVVLRHQLAPVYDKHLRLTVDRLLLRLPVVGPILLKAASARILRGMASLLEVGAGIGPKLAELGELGDNRELALRFREFIEAVKEGNGLANSCRQSNMFPPLVEQMLRIGEEQGSLARLLDKAARIFEEDVESSLVTFVALLEPLAMLILGVVVGTLVLASALPILSLMKTL